MVRRIRSLALLALCGMLGLTPAATGQGPPAGQDPPAEDGAAEFSGHLVSLDFQQADLRAVLRTFSAISGLNVVIDPGVAGVVDVALRDVPWDQALDVILRTNRLGYAVEGSIVRIVPLAMLAEEEAERRKLAEERALAGELVLLTRTLSFARAPAMAVIVTPLLSARGQVQTDERTNTMIITDLQDRVAAAERLLDELDRREPQVEIEAHIVQASQDFARAIGVRWGLAGSGPDRTRVNGRLGGRTPTAGIEAGHTEAEGAGAAVDLPAANATSALGLSEILPASRSSREPSSPVRNWVTAVSVAARRPDVPSTPSMLVPTHNASALNARPKPPEPPPISSPRVPPAAIAIDNPLSRVGPPPGVSIIPPVP